MRRLERATTQAWSRCALSSAVDSYAASPAGKPATVATLMSGRGLDRGFLGPQPPPHRSASSKLLRRRDATCPNVRLFASALVKLWRRGGIVVATAETDEIAVHEAPRLPAWGLPDPVAQASSPWAVSQPESSRCKRKEDIPPTPTWPTHPAR